MIKQVKMDVLKYGIGIDMAKEKFDACVSAIDSCQRVKIKAQRKFPNNAGGFKAFLSWVEKNSKVQTAQCVFLMEATGIYYEKLAWFLFKKSCSVSVILPNKAKKYMQALGLKSKNDTIDAKGLSRMCCEQNHTPWKPLSDSIYDLRMMTRQIESMSDQATALKNQLHALQRAMHRNRGIERMYEKQIATLEKNKATLQATVEQTIEKDAALKDKFTKICKIKGVGVQSLAVIVAETNGFAGIKNVSQLVSYSGYDIVENQSGKRKGKTKISKKGNSHIRRALFFPAFNVVKYKVKPFLGLYERVFDRTKIKMKAYTAVQKKLLEIIYALWKKDEAFDPDYHQDGISRDLELAPAFTSAPKEPHNNDSCAEAIEVKTESPKQKIVPTYARTTQDEHPSKCRRMPSFTYR